MVELGGERFIVSQYERGTAGLFDQLGHGVGFAGAGDAEQDLVLFAIQEAAEELVDGGGLVAAGTVIDAQVEAHKIRIAADVVAWACSQRPDRL